ncbi:MAG: glucose-6-phosphate dehydrogenase [Spirochaetales bacterium]|nr:glucose-6-phosphate dehydrogenase [Spirochaetales bacterium]
MKADKAAIVILGATGDLAQRKLIPALDLLYQQNNLGEGTILVGSGRKPVSHEDFKSLFNASKDFEKQMFYHQGIEGLWDYLKTKGEFNRIIVFLALPPETYEKVTGDLAKEGFGEETFLIVEKPFGRDIETARHLNRTLTTHFREDHIFRSDHYLAKEAVQNILIFRFANSVFEPSWNNHFVESIQINAFEEIGVEDRGAYYDTAGSIRDMIQNHLFQLLCLVTMEAPVSLNSEDIRNQKINILKNLRVVNTYRGQYEGYRNEKGIKENSDTETYAEMELRIDNYRWAGVPIYIRTGKATNRKGTEIGLKFKHLPEILFNQGGNLEPNKIIIKVQPAEGILLDLSGKIPGMNMEIVGTKMAFCYRESFNQNIPEAYQKLLLDALKGDRTLFVSARETETSWEVIQPYLDTGDVFIYRKGSCPKTSFGDIWIDFSQYAGFC